MIKKREREKKRTRMQIRQDQTKTQFFEMIVVYYQSMNNKCMDMKKK